MQDARLAAGMSASLAPAIVAGMRLTIAAPSSLGQEASAPKPGLRAAWWAAIKLGPSISLHMLPMMAACDSKGDQGLQESRTLRERVLRELPAECGARYLCSESGSQASLAPSARLCMFLWLGSRSWGRLHPELASMGWHITHRPSGPMAPWPQWHSSRLTCN